MEYIDWNKGEERGKGKERIDREGKGKVRKGRQWGEREEENTEKEEMKGKKGRK